MPTIDNPLFNNLTRDERRGIARTASRAAEVCAVSTARMARSAAVLRQTLMTPETPRRSGHGALGLLLLFSACALLGVRDSMALGDHWTPWSPPEGLLRHRINWTALV